MAKAKPEKPEAKVVEVTVVPVRIGQLDEGDDFYFHLYGLEYRRIANDGHKVQYTRSNTTPPCKVWRTSENTKVYRVTHSRAKN